MRALASRIALYLIIGRVALAPLALPHQYDHHATARGHLILRVCSWSVAPGRTMVVVRAAPLDASSNGSEAIPGVGRPSRLVGRLSPWSNTSIPRLTVFHQGNHLRC